MIDLDKLEQDTNNFVHDASYMERVNILINQARKQKEKTSKKVKEFGLKLEDLKIYSDNAASLWDAGEVILGKCGKVQTRYYKTFTVIGTLQDELSKALPQVQETIELMIKNGAED